MRVAIVSDWLTNQGGSERVVEALTKAFPEAPIYTSVYNSQALPQFAGKDIRTSFLQHWPLAKTRHQLYPLLRELAFESFDFSEYDVVVSATSAEAKGVVTKPQTLHIGYIYTPVRYYWSEYNNYIKHPGFGIFNPLIRLTAPRLIAKAKVWDFAAAQRPDVLFGISSAVSERIKKYYNRDAGVLFPGVDLHRYHLGKTERKGFVSVGRLIAYKRFDLAIEACNQLGAPLTIIGRGPELSRLKKLAGPTTTFITDADDAEVARRLAQAEAFLFPGEEDYGITVLEANAAGTPVIAYKAGGALDTIKEDETGVFFEKQSVPALVEAMKKLQYEKFTPSKLREHAETFDQQHFIKQFRHMVQTQYEKHQQTYPA